MLHIIEGYVDLPIRGSMFDGLPSCCIIEDSETSLRWLLNASSVMADFVWNRARQIGAEGILWPTAEGVLMASPVEVDASLTPWTTPPLVTTPKRIWVPFPGFSAYIATGGFAGAVALAKPPKSGLVQLHLHTEYSALDGLSRIDEVLDQVEADGQGAVAVTDHGACAGHPELQKKAAARDIKPIFGVEANFVNNRKDTSSRDYWHLILLAQNDVGLRNLWAASTQGYVDGYHGRSRMDWETLETFSEGLLCSTACLRGPLSDLILAEDYDGALAMLGRLQGIFGDRLMLELHTNHIAEQITLNERLVVLGQERSIPLVVVSDSHYACHADHDLHRTWMAIQTNSDLDESGMFDDGEHYHVSSAAEVAASIAYLGPQVVEAAMRHTVDVADSCTATIKQRHSTPIYHRHGYDEPVLQDNKSLREKCYEAYDRRCAHKPNALVYKNRLEEELALLTKKTFAGYMLLVWDQVHYAKSNGVLMGPGRGSAAGSVVCWLLRITEVDPVRYRLRFGRFLTPGRTSLPDIDSDFPTSKRDFITDYTIGRWGAEHVARVGTHTRLKSKGVIKNVASVLMRSGYQLFYPDIEECSRIITLAEAGTAGLGMSWEDLWFQYGDYQRDPEKGSITLNQARAKYPDLFAMADKLVGRLKSYSRHAAGLVIDPMEPIVDRLPLRRSGKEGQLTTEFDMEALEFLGYVKLDDLTLRTLDTIQLCLDLISADPYHAGSAPNFFEWDDDVEYLDPDVWDSICSGDTLGIFQIETSEGTRLTRRFQPRSIEDLGAVVTLVRPGPMRSGLTESYLKRRKGEEAVSFAHPLLAEVLEPTYGTMIYQEDIMDVCRILAGYDDDQADGVRKILGKKKVSATVEAGQKFVSAATERGIDRNVVETMWEQMAEFAKYSFNRSHAIGYAVLAYWTAWLKKHFPAHYVTALLSTVEKERIPEFVQMARRLGYKVLPPDINQSGKGFAVGQDRVSVRYGLDSVSGIGDSAMNAIVAGQPYASWDDFVARKSPKADMGVVKKLARLGAFDSILPEGYHRARLEAHLAEVDSGEVDRCLHLAPGAARGMREACTFDWSGEPVVLGKSGRPLKARPVPKACNRACRQYTELPKGAWPDVKPHSDSIIRWRERNLLGVFLSSSPFDRISDEDRKQFQMGSTILSGPSGRYFTAALVNSFRTYRSKSGEMAFADFYAFDDNLSVTIFNSVWEKYRGSMEKDGFCVLILDKNDRGITLVEYHPLAESKEID